MILHLLRLADDDTVLVTDPIPDLSLVALEGAIALWRYFRSHHRRARWLMNGGVENKEARLILDWIKRHNVESFTRSELTSDLRWLNRMNGGPDGVLGWMEDRHLIRKAPTPLREPGKRGQAPSPAYEVNPSLIVPRNTRNTENPETDPIAVSSGGESLYSSYSSYSSVAETGNNSGEGLWEG